jgi:MerR family regulatory protein.
MSEAMNNSAYEQAGESTSARITRRAESLSMRLRAVGERVFPPSAQKSLRSFSSGEVAEIVGVSDGYLRQLSLDGLGPVPELGPSGRRSYTLEQVNELRAYLASVRPRKP